MRDRSSIFIDMDHLVEEAVEEALEFRTTASARNQE